MDIVIIGGGISGLSLAYEIKKRCKGINLQILESEARLGGKIWTDRINGYICEAGVNGFLDNKPATLQLASELNLKPMRSNDNARKRYIYFDGKLRLIPTSPPTFFMSNFLSVKGKLRMLKEFFVPKDVKDDESMQDFAIRRVGKEFFEKLLDPMASGVYAGDPSRLSIRSCFNKVYELEQKYGSLIKGFIALAKENKKSGKKTEAGPGGTLHSFEHGMYSLIEALKEKLNNEFITNKVVLAVDFSAKKYTIHCKDGTSLQADIVVSACPAHNASEIFSSFDKALSSLLACIQYPPLTVVTLGFEIERINHIDLNGFGFLVPGKERRKILGTLFDSSIFLNRAPQGKILIRCMVGGARYPELAMLDDNTLKNTVLQELDSLMGLNAHPEFIKFYRWQRAIPQYNLGHYKILQQLEQILNKYTGLYLTGNAFKGVAVNDCIANSVALAERIVGQIKV